MNFTQLIIGFLLIIIFIFLYHNYKKDVSYLTSRLDRRKYMVYNLKYKQIAADMLAKMRHKLTKLCVKLKEDYPDDDRIIRLNNKFDPNVIVENEPNSKNTSYSINKGEKIVLCLRSRDGQDRIVKENILTFVSLHELAHIMTLSVGHTKEFWDNFEFLLREAIKNGYYEHIDFNKTPYKYCGVEITDTPLNR